MKTHTIMEKKISFSMSSEANYQSLKLALLPLLLLLVFNSSGTNYSSTLSGGNWASSSTWTGGPAGTIPGNGDNVTITASSTVTVNTTTASISTLTVNGTLEFQSGTARTVNCTNLTISVSGIFRTNTSGTITGHALNVSGNIINNGTLDFYTNGGNADADITFTGASNNSFSGTGATNDIQTITINKGSSASNVLDLTVSNFTVRGVTTNVAGFLTLSNGTFKISGSFTMTNRVFTSAAYTIGSSCGFYLNNANFTVAAQSSSVGWYGTVTIDAGTFNVGTASDHNLSYFGATAVYVINGGVLNVASSIQPYYDANNYTYSVDYTQTGGTVTVNLYGNTFPGSNNRGYPSMWVTASSSFTMSGGTIVVQGENSLWDYDYDCSAGTRNITGGTVQMGNASSGAAKRYGITGYLPNLVVTNTSGNHTVELYKVNTSPNTVYIYNTTTLQSNTTLDANSNSMSATFVGDLTISTGATFDAGNVVHYVDSDWINNGTLTYRTSDIHFNGSSAQQILGSAATTFYDVTMDNSAGLTLAPSSGIVTTIRHSLTFNNGCITLGNFNLDVETGGYDGTSSGLYSYSSTKFVVTNGTGVLKRYDFGSASGSRTGGTFPIGISTSSYTPITITVTSTTTNDNFSARVSQGVYVSGTTGSVYTSKVVNRTWNVSEGTPGGSNVTLQVQWNSTEELTSFSRTNCLVSHYSSGAWNNTSGLSGAGGSNPYTRTSGTVTSFSPFAVTSTTTLPIELLNFDAKPQGNEVITSWTTASETNNDYFTLERSADGNTFEKIGTVSGAGNSTSMLNYSETDTSPLPGTSYYRLKQTDYDGKYSYSQMVSVDFTSSNKVIIYQNMLNGDAFASYQLTSPCSVTIEIFDITGKLIKVPVQNEFLTEGTYHTLLNIGESQGIYFARVTINNKISSYKIIH
jgi:hypothetical protein